MVAAPVSVVGQTRNLLRKWPQLWIPPLLVYFVQSLGAAAYSNVGIKLLGAICATAACALLNLGWVALLLDTLRGNPPQFKTVPEIVNQRWTGALAGHFAYYLLSGGLILLLGLYGHSQWGTDALKTWFESWRQLPPTELSRAIAPDKIPPDVANWLSLLGYWLCITAGLTILLSAWLPLMLIEQTNWLRAYVNSVRLTLRHFFAFALLAALHVLAVGLSLRLLGLANAFATLAGLAFYLYANTLFQASYVLLTFQLRQASSPDTAEESSK